MSNRQRLKSLLLGLSYEKREVVLSSGRRSDFYFDGKQTALHPEGAYLLGRMILELIRQKMPDAEAVGGPTLGADPLVTAVSIASFSRDRTASCPDKTASCPSNLPAFIIRKEPKKHGTEAWIEGFKNLRSGMKVVILEDVMTTGESALKAIDKAEKAGLDVIGIIVVVDREEGGREAVEAKGRRLEALFTKSELLKK